MLCLTEKNQENKQEENSQVESTQIKYIFFMRLLAEQQRQKQRSKEETSNTIMQIEYLYVEHI